MTFDQLPEPAQHALLELWDLRWRGAVLKQHAPTADSPTWWVAMTFPTATAAREWHDKLAISPGYFLHLSVWTRFEFQPGRFEWRHGVWYDDGTFVSGGTDSLF